VTAIARRRTLVAAGIALVAVVVALVVVLGGGKADQPPANEAATLVPAGALAYLHVSTDRTRSGVDAARRLAQGFPSWSRLRAALIRQLAAPRCGVTAAALRGKEAALALYASGGHAIRSLVLIDTGTKATRTGAVRSCGRVSAERIGRFLAIGQRDALGQAAALAAGRGRALAADPVYRHASAGLPAGRVADGYVTAEGLRRVVAAQGGIAGAAGVLLDQPGLHGAAFALEARAPGARIVVHEIKTTGRPAATFAPSLDTLVPSGALAYVGVRGLGDAIGRLLNAAGGSTSGAAGSLLARAESKLTGPLRSRLRALLDQETALVLVPALPAPVLTVIAKVGDEAAARRTMADLQAPLAALFAPPATGDAGLAPTFDEQRVDGLDAFRLRLGPGLELDYAVFDGKVVASTSMAGLRAIRGGGTRLPATAAYRAVLGGRPGKISSIAFLDFSKLLRLGEQTGLDANRAYQRVRRDLARVRAVGATSTGDADETTVQLELSIP
jgi:hypothetical protein